MTEPTREQVKKLLRFIDGDSDEESETTIGDVIEDWLRLHDEVVRLREWKSRVYIVAIGACGTLQRASEARVLGAAQMLDTLRAALRDEMMEGEPEAATHPAPESEKA